MDFDEILDYHRKAISCQNFIKALGGQSGEYAGYMYQIVNLHGHMMTFKEPEEMVTEDLRKAYKSWTLKYLPWQLRPNELAADIFKTTSAKNWTL